MVTTQFSQAFVELADTIGEDFDAAAFLLALTRRSVQLMDIAAAGVLLTDAHAAPRRRAASSRAALRLQHLQARTGQGPAVDCCRTGRGVSADDVRADDRWPEFTAGAAGAGFAAVHTVAMRHRARTIGALSFFTTWPGPLDPSSLVTGRALSDIATIGLLQRDSIQAHETRTLQLQTALDSRILIEQAKGILAERLGLSVTDAFSLLRQQARSHNRRLHDVAQGIVRATDPPGPPATDQPASPSSAGRTGPLGRPALPA